MHRYEFEMFGNFEPATRATLPMHVGHSLDATVLPSINVAAVNMLLIHCPADPPKLGRRLLSALDVIADLVSKQEAA